MLDSEKSMMIKWVYEWKNSQGMKSLYWLINLIKDLLDHQEIEIKLNLMNFKIKDRFLQKNWDH